VDHGDEDDEEQMIKTVVVDAGSDHFAAATSNSNWNPITLQSVHKDTKFVKHNTVTILLPGGVGHIDSQEISISLQSNNTVLKAEILWPNWIVQEQFIGFLRMQLKQGLDCLQGPPMIQKMSLEEDFVDKFCMMKNSMKEELSNLNPDPEKMVKATAFVNLKLRVQDLKEDCWNFFGETTGVCMLFVNLKEPAVPVAAALKARVKKAMIDTIIEQAFWMLVTFRTCNKRTVARY